MTDAKALAAEAYRYTTLDHGRVHASTSHSLINRLATALEAVAGERDAAQSMVTAGQGVFESIEAHIRDRIAMRDPANPELYLEIIRGDVSRVIRDSQMISNSRWAEANRARDGNEALRTRVAQVEEAAAILLLNIRIDERTKRYVITPGHEGQFSDGIAILSAALSEGGKT